MTEEQADAPATTEPAPEPRRVALSDLTTVQRAGTGFVAVLAAAAVLVHFGFGSRGVVSGAFAAVLVVLAAFDLSHGLIPNRILVPAAAVMLILQIGLFSGSAPEWVLAGTVAGVILLVPAVVRRGTLGMGDVKLAAFLGIGLGWTVFGALLLGSLTAVPFALGIMLRRGEARGQTMPLAPFLATGGILAMLLSSSL